MKRHSVLALASRARRRRRRSRRLPPRSARAGRPGSRNHRQEPSEPHRRRGHPRPRPRRRGRLGRRRRASRRQGRPRHHRRRPSGRERRRTDPCARSRRRERLRRRRQSRRRPRRPRHDRQRPPRRERRRRASAPSASTTDARAPGILQATPTGKRAWPLALRSLLRRSPARFPSHAGDRRSRWVAVALGVFVLGNAVGILWIWGVGRRRRPRLPLAQLRRRADRAGAR